MNLFFDITTSLCWSGTPVGIVRVEREMAKGYAARPKKPLRYCFIHPPSQTFYELPAELAAQILAGEYWIDRADLDSLSWKNGMSSTASAHEEAVLAALSAARSDAAIQTEFAAIARNLSAKQLLNLRQRLDFVQLNHAGSIRMTRLQDLILQPVPLSPDTCIVSGGLDWEYKDLRRLRQMKDATGFRYVTVVYDLIPLQFPHFVVPSYADLLRRFFGELFWTADFILCISEATRTDIKDYLKKWRMPDLPTEVWPLGSDLEVGSAPSVLQSALTGRPYFVYVSTIEPRKNHRILVDAFEACVRSSLVPDDAACVFVGRTGWNSGDLIHEIENNPVLKDRVIILSEVSDANLNCIYQGARFVVFPSKSEGFGLALVEAMALGKACVTSEASALTEVGGDATFHVGTSDTVGWTRALEAFMTDDDLVRAYEARSRAHYTPVSWAQSGDAFFEKLSGWLEAVR